MILNLGGGSWGQGAVLQALLPGEDHSCHNCSFVSSCAYKLTKHLETHLCCNRKKLSFALKTSEVWTMDMIWKIQMYNNYIWQLSNNGNIWMWHFEYHHHHHCSHHPHTDDHTRLQKNGRKSFLQHKEHVIHISVSLVEYWPNIHQNVTNIYGPSKIFVNMD